MTDRASALRHERHYTVAEANAERGWAAEQVTRVRTSLELLADPESQDALDALDPDSGGGYPGRDVAIAVMGLLAALSELESKEVLLRDPERGLVDFPSIRDGEEVYLCWLVDEDEVSWWHEHDTGFAGRQPI
jgi:hypothetical protein